jgi:hypothetical protein
MPARVGIFSHDLREPACRQGCAFPCIKKPDAYRAGPAHFYSRDIVFPGMNHPSCPSVYCKGSRDGEFIEEVW